MSKKKVITPAEREKERANNIRRYRAELLMYTDEDTNEIDIVRLVRDTIFRLEVLKRSLWKLVASADNTGLQPRALKQIYALSVRLGEAYEYYDTIRQPPETDEDLDRKADKLIKSVMKLLDEQGPSQDQNDKS